MKICFCFFFTLVFLLNATATEYFVDYDTGRKGNNGTREKPFPNFASAYSKLKPGDTLRILPSRKPIRDTIRFSELKGTAENPICIDGMNNSFIGSVPLKAKDWKEIKPGLFCRKRQISTNMASRYYMIHKGQAVFMGRSTKGFRNPAYKKPEELQPGEWTIVDLNPGSKEPKHLFAFYLRTADGEKDPQAGKWEEPSKISGVAISSFCTKDACGHTRCGKECTHVHCENVQIRNMIARHFWNDGYNIHGKVRNVLFENIAAIECGDDGISAHNECEITTKNYLSLRNSTGICHIQQAVCKHDNVYIEGTRGVDFYLFPQSSCTLTNAYIAGNSRRGILLDNKTPTEVMMKDCFILNENPDASFTCSKQCSATFENVHASGYKKAPRKAGIVAEADAETLKKTIGEKRKVFFSLFRLNQK